MQDNEWVNGHKESDFESYLAPEYFTIWDGYLETPISWFMSDRWIANIDELDFQGHNTWDDILNEWITDNEDYLWQIYEGWLEDQKEV